MRQVKQKANMFDADKVSYQALLPAVWLQNHFKGPSTPAHQSHESHEMS